MNFKTQLFSFGAVSELPSSATIRPFRGPLRSRPPEADQALQARQPFSD